MRYATPKKTGFCFLAYCLLGVAAWPSVAEDKVAEDKGKETEKKTERSAVNAKRPTFSREAVRKSATQAVQLVERTSAKFLETRGCFTCHTQTLSTMVLKNAMDIGIQIDEQNLRQQHQRALTLHGELNGLRVDTVGYGLWALDIGQHAPDKMTEDMVRYILNYRRELGHWKITVDRPPAEASEFTTNYVAIRGLNRYGTAKQQREIAARTDAVKKWLATATAKDTEDLVFQLRLTDELKLAPANKKSIVEKLLGEQRDSGGWSQKSGMHPDAYATGIALVALHDAGGVRCDHAAWQQGIKYLLRTQQRDGSWHVATRAEPLQVYFESGFPHGKDQFISAYATGWATKALLLSLKVQPR